MIKKKYFCFLFVLVFLLFLLNWNYIQAESTIISGKLKKINRDIHIAVGKDGNAVVVWNYNKANNATYGRIYLVELNRVDTGYQGSGTWEAGNPQLVSKKGQRPSVTYLPAFDQYLIVWDTGLTELSDYEKNQPASKIQCSRYNPSYGDKSDAAPYSFKPFTLVGGKKIVVGHEFNYLHPDVDFELCHIAYTEAEIPSKETKFLKNKKDWETRLMGGKVGVYIDDIFSGIWELAEGKIVLCGSKVWNDKTYLAWKRIITEKSPETSSGLLKICNHTWGQSVLHIGHYKGIDKNSYTKNILAFGVNSSEGYAVKDLWKGARTAGDNDWITGIFDNNGDVEATYPFPVNDVITAGTINTKTENSPNDTAKKSDIYIVYAQTNGTVGYFNVSTEGKPGKAFKIFKTKKNSFGDMDVTYMQDEDKVLMVYSEYLNKKKTKSAVKFTTFEIK